MVRILLVLALLMGGQLSFASGSAASAKSFPKGNVVAVGGASIEARSLRGAKGTLLIFVSTECPISNGYVPTINQLGLELAEQGIGLVLLNPNSGQSAEQVREHRMEYNLQPEVYLDPGAALAAEVGVTHCPEACLYDASGKLVYQGRVDDRYAIRGKAARPVSSHDLKDAIAKMRAGERPPTAYAAPIGCPIAGLVRSPIPKAAGSVTYSEHVAGVLARHCQECHRPEGIGPFSLLSYQQAVDWAEDIATFVADGTMPPWKPADGFGEFHNRRGLSDLEKNQIAEWVASGCPEGDPSLTPPPVDFPEGWVQGTPDLVIGMEEKFEVDADGPDVYRNFVFKTNFDSDRYLTGYEVLPSNRRVVHHVLLFVDTSGRGERLDARDPGPGYSANGEVGLPGFIPTSMLGGWAPGNSPHQLREGMARILPKGATIVMQVHYHKTGKVEHDQTQVGLYLTSQPPKRAVGVMPLEPVSARIGTFIIPKNAPDHVIGCTANLPRGLTVVSVTPHMHLLGRSMKVVATLPDETVVPLVYIPSWDFNWQETYYFKEPVELPAGTKVTLEAHFDNSDGNPNNPHRPPQVVRYGEQTTEEMCLCFLEAAWHGEAKTVADLRPPELDDLFEYQVDRLLKFLRR